MNKPTPKQLHDSAMALADEAILCHRNAQHEKAGRLYHAAALLERMAAEECSTSVFDRDVLMDSAQALADNAEGVVAIGKAVQRESGR